MSESDENAALLMMKDSVDFFIKSYETALEEIRGKTPHVVLISPDAVRRRMDQIKNSRPKQGQETEKA